DVILHEMGHVLGLGTNYLLIGLVDGFPFDPHYTGRAGVAAHQELGGDRYVPLEDQGGLGTAVGHWRESVFGNELMTGYLNQGSQPLSRLTVAALADLGYGVDLSAADPYSIPSGPAASRQEPPLHLHTIPIEPGIGGPRRRAPAPAGPGRPARPPAPAAPGPGRRALPPPRRRRGRPRRAPAGARTGRRRGRA